MPDIDVGWIAIVLTVLNIGWELWQVRTARTQGKQINKLTNTLFPDASYINISHIPYKLVKELADSEITNVGFRAKIDLEAANLAGEGKLRKAFGFRLEASASGFSYYLYDLANYPKLVNIIKACKDKIYPSSVINKLKESTEENTKDIKFLQGNHFDKNICEANNKKFQDEFLALHAKKVAALEEEIKALKEAQKPQPLDINQIAEEIRSNARTASLVKLHTRLLNEGPKHLIYTLIDHYIRVKESNRDHNYVTIERYMNSFIGLGRDMTENEVIQELNNRFKV